MAGYGAEHQRLIAKTNEFDERAQQLEAEVEQLKLRRDDVVKRHFEAEAEFAELKSNTDALETLIEAMKKQ